MKKNIKYFLFFTTLLLISLNACKPDKDDDTQGTDIDRFLGSWICEESSSLLGPSTFTVNIETDPLYENQVLLSNFYHLGYSEKPYGLTSSNIITVPNQYVCDSTMTINGDGDLRSDGKIYWTYYSNDGANIDTVTAIYTKQ